MTLPESSAAPHGSTQVSRGGVFILGAKIYFTLIGLVQQVALKSILGLSGYGAYSTAQAVASITYNPVVQTSIQGVSRTLAAAPLERRPALLYRVLRWHAAVAIGLGLVFLLLAQPTANLLGAPHVGPALRVLAAVVCVYGLYAPLIGALNGERRFGAQAALDVAAATLRTFGLLVGAWLWIRLRGSAGTGAVVAANAGFALVSVLVLVTAVLLTGWGKRGAAALGAAEYARFTLPVFGGQILLNLLFQADSLLLRRFAGEAAASAGLLAEAADPYVGAYRAAQMFCFLPYQLLMSVTFVLFPLLAEARAHGEDERTKKLIQGGMRLGTLATGAMVSVYLALPEGLIRLVYGSDAAALGAASMRPLSIGLGAFALVGIMTSVLNSLGRPGQSLGITALATLLVVGFCSAAAWGEPLSARLLENIATATLLAMLVTTLVCAAVLQKAVGAAIPLLTLGRVGLAVAAAAFVTDALLSRAPRSALWTLLGAALVLGIYVGSLLLSRELNRTDLEHLSSLRGPKRNS